MAIGGTARLPFSNPAAAVRSASNLIWCLSLLLWKKARREKKIKGRDFKLRASHCIVFILLPCWKKNEKLLKTHFSARLN